MANILVIGGSGYIGRNLVEELQKQHEITVIDNLIYSDYKYEDKTNIKFILKSIRELKQEDIENYDIIINLACVHLLYSISFPINDLEINSLAVLRLLEYLKNIKENSHKNIHFINFSSGSVLQIRNNNVFVPYAISKNTAEHYMEYYHNTYYLKLSAIRPFHIYGKGGRGVIDKFIRSNNYQIHGNGQQNICPTYIDDLIKNVVYIIDNEITGLFNVCSGESFSINQIVDELDSIFGKKLREYVSQPNVYKNYQNFQTFTCFPIEYTTLKTGLAKEYEDIQKKKEIV